MLQTELTTDTAVNAQTNNDLAKKGDILKRIEALNKWQEEQKKLLEARQTLQRKMLGMEQRSMYEMLGLENESKISMIEQLKKTVKEQDTATEAVEQTEEYEEMTEMTDESLETSQLDAEGVEEDSNIDSADYEALSSVDDKEVNTEVETKPKKPFLKRGDGLKQRFKINPDELRLNNLPKYKFANAHPKLRLKPINFSKTNKDSKTQSTNPVNSSGSNAKPPSNPATLDAKEQRFQNLLITSKNTCSSTPDVKTIKSTSAADNKNSKEQTLPPKIRECKSTEAAKTNPAATNVVAWSKILDPSEIQPLQVPRKSVQSSPPSEDTIFELLEQKANEGSFDMESTCLKDFMTRRLTEKLNESDDNIIVQEQLKTKRLEPVVNDKSIQDYSCCSSQEDEVEEEESQYTEDIKSSESDDSTHKTVEKTNSSQPQQTSQVRVRFSDSNETHEYEEQASFNDGKRLPGGKNPTQGQGDDTGNNDLFIQFKHALFSVLQLKGDQPQGNDLSLKSVSETTLTPKNSLVNAKNRETTDSVLAPACKELQDKTDLIKVRLSELEKEIQNFKNSNVMLLKAKQEHELQKSLNAQEHFEAMENLKDEKIRMEIYLHDERAKLEDEKRQFEQNLKTKNQAALAKERKENERLRQQIAQLELQLKTKENNHTTAQARLRSQIRNLEKEQSKLHEQIENLAKEVKRLENENLKISREQSNKILLEINRNIAKLAPKQQIQNSSTSTSDEGNTGLSATLSVSKCIVAAATANRNVGKGYKVSNAKFSNAKTVANKKATLQKYEETERALQSSLMERKQQQTNYKFSDDEDDDDILREFQISPEKRKNKLAGGQKNDNGKCANHTPPKAQKVPEAPPSSPRTCGGSNNMKREIVNSDGSKDIWYPNGNLKKISADGMIIRMLCYNKDIKETNINEGTVKYYYAETNTWHTTYLDGLEILEFPNGQIEHRYKNGVIEVHYPNNSVKIMNPKDEQKQEEWRFPDGTHLVQMRNGDKILTMPNGQKEIHNKLHKRREYPDGTIKIIYPDGSAETRYSNGRVRLKDKEGKLVMDTEMA